MDDLEDLDDDPVPPASDETPRRPKPAEPESGAGYDPQKEPTS